jgi:hypothetical protein
MAKAKDAPRKGDCPVHGENRPEGCEGDCKRTGKHAAGDAAPEDK